MNVDYSMKLPKGLTQITEYCRADEEIETAKYGTLRYIDWLDWLETEFSRKGREVSTHKKKHKGEVTYALFANKVEDVIEEEEGDSN